ncbi:TssQ family T6SS-associated lipoprotein [Diaphorobacter aerolatus]|uniref:TssQ family T6SS-associated lipoprotein n=1 Tax=Diaphorobacter aerolatus TaxID=1288495 RepID=A0A7H0GLB2_9BURK|nr:TssQ family T6SS-associated lipoprotein [Diaphorobacter aerolatus]QNP49078.1 TssQ family T6SS-associated lipoprotein [Diaphorobacter aerolatus]
MLKNVHVLAPVVVALLVLSGCESAPPKKAEPPVEIPVQPPPPEPPPPPTSRAERIEAEPTATNDNAALTAVERRFAEGLAQYNDGNYPDAIRIFREPVFSRAWPELQIKSLKYLAFSYCVNNNANQCRATFLQLLKIDPAFELSNAESGHPVWGQRSSRQKPT